jgi:hypothetical protein
MKYASAHGQRRAFYANTPATGNTLGNTRPQEARNEESPAVTKSSRAYAYISEGDGNRTRNHRIDRRPRATAESTQKSLVTTILASRGRSCK